MGLEEGAGGEAEDAGADDGYGAVIGGGSCGCACGAVHCREAGRGETMRGWNAEVAESSM